MRNFKKFLLSFDFSANNPWRIFVFQLIAGAGLIFHIFNSGRTEWIFCVTVYFLINILGGTITYHRLLTHKSFKPYTWFTYVGPLLGTLIGAGSTIAWVANHREHHQYADKPKDPHSPHNKPWYKIQWGSMFHKPRIKYATDLLRSPFHLFLHKYYWLIHLVYICALFLISPSAVIFVYLAPAALAWNASSLVNVVNHFKVFGYRNFDTPDMSVNNVFTALLVGGEGYHNNHHAKPLSYSFSQKWYEFDLSAYIIRFFLSSKPVVTKS